MGVGLFVLALAIFYWGLHSRLTQYASSHSNGGTVQMVKMWLGERGHPAAVAGASVERAPLLASIFVLLGWSFDVYACFFVLGYMRWMGQWLRPPLWVHGHALYLRPPPFLASV
jgi:hypothetical protein